jgi:exonuclease SbcC
MRPVQLTMEGFASFRNKTEVDFSDAEYFALVGPTGSGKSTVIDAMTFALYGTVYRWADAKMVANALAPTSNRGYVSLIFDSGGNRYHAVREVRRSGGKNPQVKTSNVALFRYLDPHAVPVDGVEPDAENLLGDSTDVRDLTRQITRIVGLDLKDFCQCVVLPQGDFAQFLHAGRPQRNAILLKLLDIGDHEALRRAARSRAEKAKTEAETLTRQLAEAGDGSEDAEHAAREVADRLKETTEQLRRQVPAFTTVVTDAQEATAALTQVRTDRQTIAPLAAAPAGLAGVMDTVTTARADLEAAEKAAAAAVESLTTATTDRAAGPDRSTVNQALTDYRRRDQLVAEHPSLVAAATEAAARAEAARTDVADRTQTADVASTAVTDATEQHRTATGQVEALERQLDRYTLTVPANVGQLSADLAHANASAKEARAALTDAEQAGNQATAPLRELTDLGYDTVTLATADRMLTQLQAATDEFPNTHTKLTAATAQLDEADQQLHAAQDHLKNAQADYQAAVVAHAGAELRDGLHLGDPCPVCTQTVTVLPPAESTDPRQEARVALEAAERRHTDAHTRREEAAASAATARNRWQATLDKLADRAGSLADTLPPDPPVPAALAGTTPAAYTAARTGVHQAHQQLSAAQDRDTSTSTDTSTDNAAELVATLAPHLAALAPVLQGAAGVHEQLTADLTSAGEQVNRCRHQLESAEEAVEQLRKDDGAARTALASATGALRNLGCPDAETLLSGADLATAWGQLAAWVATQAEALDSGPLAQAREEHARTAKNLRVAEEKREQAAKQLDTAREKASSAERNETRTATDLSTREQQVAELEETLATAPPVAQLTADLAECDRLDQAVDSATRTSRQASADREAARKQVDALNEQVQDACAHLRQARDRVAHLGAPSVRAEAGVDLSVEWEKLVGWGTAKRDELAGEEEAQTRALTDAAARQEELTRQVEVVLAAHDVNVSAEDRAGDENLARVAAAAATLAHQRAETAVRAVLDIRKRCADLTEQVAAATTRAQVAKTLADLMRNDHFPQWLADSVLDNLVTAASQSLRTLSNNQFSLTHEDGEFYVIDHNDADMSRSVRTLSGGETFQTSLALALALADQLAELGAGGASRLESIFLDEGFGTLDPEALDTVAVTLESLAQGDRMVGVVTHVTALAERATLRYQVRRVNNVSTVTREGP